MSLLSRFRKQKENEASDELDETLANSEEEGLLMSTGAEQASPEKGAEPTAETPVDQEKDATNQAEVDDLLEAAQDEPAAAESSDATLTAEDAPASEMEVDDLMEAAQDEPAAAEGADVAPGDENAAASDSGIDDLLEVAQGDGAGAEQEGAAEKEKEKEDPFETGTDALAAFEETEVESEIGDLLKGLEEVSVDELLTDLREIRAMLPQIEEGQEEA